MARQIESRYKISGTLIAETPLHIGGRGGDPLVDLALAINGKGEYYISGTSLAGTFKNWMQDCFEQKDELLANRLWGFSEKDGDSNKGHASFVLVEDAVIELPEGTDIEIRDGVGIDRQWGSAAERIKYDRAIIPRGASFNLELTVEIPKATKTDSQKNKIISVENTSKVEITKATETLSQVSSDNFMCAMKTLLATLQAGEIKLGAAKTRGLGKIKLAADYTVNKYDLLDSNKMIAASKGERKPEQFSGEVKTIPQLTITIKWKPIGALMVKTEQDGIAVDILPLVSSVNQNIAFVLPGSSIKGALRTQAERIIRTVCRTPRKWEPEGEQRFNQQLQDIPLVENIFGTAAKKQETNNGKHKLGLGALSIDDCYAKNTSITHQAWNKIISAPNMKTEDWNRLASYPQEQQKTHLRKALDEANLKTTQQAYHVAVDRWTGGAADGFLYSNLEPFGIEWENIHLTLNFKRIPENEQTAAIALILLILRDLHAGRIPLGYGVNRGMGAITVENIYFEAKELPKILNFKNTELIFTPEGIIQNFDSELLAHLQQDWQAWIECNTH